MHNRTKAKFLNCLSDDEKMVNVSTPYIKTIINLTPYDVNRYVFEGVNQLRPIHGDLIIRGNGMIFNSEVHCKGNIPMLSLRRFFIKQNSTTDSIFYKKWDKYKLFICEYEKTLEYVQSPSFIIPRKLKDHIENNEYKIYGLTKSSIKPWIDKYNPKNHSIIVCTIFRIWKLYQLMKKITTGIKNVIFYLQLMIDTHIDLMCFIWKTKFINDIDLIDPANNVESITQSGFEDNYPHQFRFMYCGNFIDISNVVDMGNLWIETIPIVNHIVKYIIHLLSCKLQQHKCHLRNYMTILFRYIKSAPSIIPIFRGLIELTFLGNYPNVQIRTEFTRRMEIRMMMSQTMGLSDVKLLVWMDENERIVHTAAKEFYLFTLLCQHALDKSLSDGDDRWNKNKETFIKSGDTIRSFLQNNVSSYEVVPTHTLNGLPRLHKLDQTLKQIHKDSGINFSKFKKSGFIKLINDVMQKWSDDFIVDVRSTNIQTSESKLNVFLIEKIKFLTTYAKKNLGAFNGDVQLCLLKKFGVTDRGYELITDLYFLYEKYETKCADNAIPNWLFNIYMNSHEDFYIMHTYFKTVLFLESTEENLLSLDYTRNQLKALRLKMGLMPWEPLPESCDKFYYCSNCMKWAHAVINPDITVTSINKKKNSFNIYEKGLSNAMWVHSKKMLTCDSQDIPVLIKKMKKNNVYDGESKYEDENTISVIRRYKESGCCSDKHLIAVHMVGKNKKLECTNPRRRKKKDDNKRWILCEKCAGLTQWNGSNFSSQFFDCNFHIKTPRKIWITSNRIINLINTPKERRDELYEMRLSHSIYHINPMSTCYYCGIKVMHIEDSTFKTVNIIDDEDPRYCTYKEVKLCISDYKAAKDFFIIDTVPLKSELFKYFKDKLNSSAMMIQPKKNMDGKYRITTNHNFRKDQ